MAKKIVNPILAKKSATLTPKITKELKVINNEEVELQNNKKPTHKTLEEILSENEGKELPPIKPQEIIIKRSVKYDWGKKRN